MAILQEIRKTSAAGKPAVSTRLHLGVCLPLTSLPLGYIQLLDLRIFYGVGKRRSWSCPSCFSLEKQYGPDNNLCMARVNCKMTCCCSHMQICCLSGTVMKSVSMAPLGMTPWQTHVWRRVRGRGGKQSLARYGRRCRAGLHQAI